MAKTSASTIERPRPAYRKPARPYYLEPGAPVPAADDLDLATLDLVDVEVWRQNKHWDRFARLRREDPLHYTPESLVGPYWSVTRRADVMAIDIDHQRFSSHAKFGGVVLGRPIEGFEEPSFISVDEPVHTPQRQAAQPALAPTRLRDYEPLIRERTRAVLDALPVGEPFDWVDRVSMNLTAMMLATLFDHPQERRRELTRWSDVATNPRDPDLCPGGKEQWMAELKACVDTFAPIYEQRRREPPGDDLMSLLAHHPATSHLTRGELLATLLLLIVGGNDTTRNTMSGSVYALNTFPGEFDKLKADPGLIPNMVSEIIRWQTPLAYMRRTALEDVDMHGKTIRKGDQVAMWYVSANRDETFWEEDPNRILIDRKQARNHVSFGFGIHRCVGNRLAELQLRVLWEELLVRFAHVEVIEEPSRLANSFVHGYSWMPVVLHPKA